MLSKEEQTLIDKKIALELIEDGINEKKHLDLFGGRGGLEDKVYNWYSNKLKLGKDASPIDFLSALVKDFSSSFDPELRVVFVQLPFIKDGTKLVSKLDIELLRQLLLRQLNKVLKKIGLCAEITLHKLPPKSKEKSAK